MDIIKSIAAKIAGLFGRRQQDQPAYRGMESAAIKALTAPTKRKHRVRGTHLRSGERYRMAKEKADAICHRFGERRINGLPLYAYRGDIVEHFLYGTPLPWKFWTKHHRLNMHGVL